MHETIIQKIPREVEGVTRWELDRESCQRKREARKDVSDTEGLRLFPMEAFVTTAG
jgi:hypothetical protein